MSITKAEGIEHSCVSVEQQALLGRQSATAMFGNDVREKSSVSEVARRKEQRTAGQRRRTESYGNATYKVSQRKGVIKRESMRSGSRRE